MATVTVAEVRALVKTSLSDSEVAALIARTEAKIIARMGAFQVAGLTTEVTEKMMGSGQNLFLRRKVSSVTSVTEDGTSLTEGTDFRVWEEQGRLERLPKGRVWGDVISVVYKPANDSDEWKDVVIDVIRVVTSRFAEKSLASGGDFSFSASDWDADIAKIIHRIMFAAV